MGAFYFYELLLGLTRPYGAELKQVPLHSLASSRPQRLLVLETELLR